MTDEKRLAVENHPLSLSERTKGIADLLSDIVDESDKQAFSLAQQLAANCRILHAMLAERITDQPGRYTITPPPPCPAKWLAGFSISGLGIISGLSNKPATGSHPMGR